MIDRTALFEPAPAIQHRVREAIQAAFVAQCSDLGVDHRTVLTVDHAYTGLFADLPLDDHIIFVAANGAYSFKGTRYRRSGVFDRLQLVQGDRTIQLQRDGYRNVRKLKAADAPDLREIGLFRIPAGTGFDPVSDWRLELLVQRETADGGRVLLTFPVDYRLPAIYRLQPQGTATAPATPTLPGLFVSPDGHAANWLLNWQARLPSIAALSAMKCFIGIDLGSTTTKAVVLDENQEVLGRGITNSRSNYDVAAAIAKQEALIDTRFHLFRRTLSDVPGLSSHLEDFLAQLDRDFRLEKYLEDLDALRHTCLGNASEDRFGKETAALREALNELFDRMQPESFSRALSRLRRHGVTTEGRTVKIEDLATLQTINEQGLG